MTNLWSTQCAGHSINVKTGSNSGGCCISVTRTQLTLVNTILWWKSNGNTGARRRVFLCWPSMHTLRCTSLFLDRITPGHVTWMERKKKTTHTLHRQTQGGQIRPCRSDDQELIWKNECEDYTLTWIHKDTIICIQFDYIFWILNMTQNSDTGGTQIQTQLFVLDFGTPIRLTLKQFQNFWALLLLESIFFERWAVGNWTELDAPRLSWPGWLTSLQLPP